MWVRTRRSRRVRKASQHLILGQPRSRGSCSSTCRPHQHPVTASRLERTSHFLPSHMPTASVGTAPYLHCGDARGTCAHMSFGGLLHLLFLLRKGVWACAHMSFGGLLHQNLLKALEAEACAHMSFGGLLHPMTVCSRFSSASPRLSPPKSMVTTSVVLAGFFT